MRRITQKLRADGARGRMIRGVLSNIFDKGAITAIQLLTIPVMTSAWGADGYGIWLMLMTVPTFIALSDFGFGVAAGAAMTQAVAQRDFAQARTILHSAFVFTSIMLGFAGAIALGFASYIYRYSEPNGIFSSEQLAGAVVIITIYSSISALMMVVTMAYRATHGFAFAMTYSGFVILIEGCATILSVHSGADILEVTLAIFCIRLFSFPVFLLLLRRKHKWVSFGFAAANSDTFRALTHPSLAALGLTVASALMLQGVLTGIGYSLGAAAVAIFGPARTLSRIPLQFAGLFLRPSLPELTHALSTGNHALARQLDRLNLYVSAVATLPFVAILTIWGPRVLKIISGENINAPHILFFWLGLSAMFNAMWNSLSTGLIAMNRQASFAPVVLASSIFTILVSIVAADANIAALAMTAAEFAVLFHVIWVREKNGK